MLETALINNQPPPTHGTTHKILHRVKNERMGGTVPSWDAPKTPQQKIELALNNAQDTQSPVTLNNALAYRNTAQSGPPSGSETKFGFGDLIDMVNPLQHIPVISHIYREITHDDIKPISRIVGGGLFGGPAGAAGGLVNAVIEEETGKSLTQNTMALVLNGEKPVFKRHTNNPETALSRASDKRPDDLPGALLSFVDLKEPRGITIERLPPREPITQVRLSGLYGLNS